MIVLVPLDANSKTELDMQKTYGGGIGEGGGGVVIRLGAGLTLCEGSRKEGG